MMEDDHMIIQPLPAHLVEGEHSHIVTKRGIVMTGDDDDVVPLPIPPTAPDPRLEPINISCNTANETLAKESEPTVRNYTENKIRPEPLGKAKKKLLVIESIVVIDHLSYIIHGENLEKFIVNLFHIVSRAEIKVSDSWPIGFVF